MKLSLNVPYKKLPADIKKSSQLTEVLIGEALNRKYPQGMPRQESRQYAQVLDQFYEDKDVVEIEPSFLTLLKEAIDKAELPPHQSSWKWSLLDHLEAVKLDASDSK